MRKEVLGEKLTQTETRLIGGGLTYDFGICLSVLCGIAEFDRCHYFPWFTVTLFWKSQLITVNSCSLSALNTQFMAL